MVEVSFCVLLQLFIFKLGSGIFIHDAVNKCPVKKIHISLHVPILYFVSTSELH